MMDINNFENNISTESLRTQDINQLLDNNLDDIKKESNHKKIFFQTLKIITIIFSIFIILSNYSNNRKISNNNDNSLKNDDKIIFNNKTDEINNLTDIPLSDTSVNDNNNKKNNESNPNQEQKDNKKEEEIKEEPKVSDEIKINDKNNNTMNNKGFLNIKTYHKGKYTNYDYNENNKVYKDLYKDIIYTPITEDNYIIPSTQFSNEDYFKLCDEKKLLNEIKYKRNPNPKITVIIAYFNKNKFSLYMPLRSIQNQSFKDIEIIFIDDGSSQNKIDEIIEEMKYDNRIILVTHKNNKGTLMSRVDGVRYASGEYIILLDQDDMFYDNLVFEKLYKKAKELNVDLVQFSTLQYKNNKKSDIMVIQTPKNIIVTQPELRTTFLNKLGPNRLGNCATRMIWDKFIRREVYLEAINDLGDEYLNHRVFLYEDTIMMFELSQVAYSYYYYDFLGYRLNTHLQGKSRDSTSQNIQIIAMNQLLFIKLLLYKIDPKFDRFHIFKEWGFSICGSEVMHLNRNDIDLLKEVIEIIDGLENIYKNTAKELLDCVLSIKKKFGIATNYQKYIYI